MDDLITIISLWGLIGQDVSRRFFRTPTLTWWQFLMGAPYFLLLFTAMYIAMPLIDFLFPFRGEESS